MRKGTDTALHLGFSLPAQLPQPLPVAPYQQNLPSLLEIICLPMAASRHIPITAKSPTAPHSGESGVTCSPSGGMKTNKNSQHQTARLGFALASSSSPGPLLSLHRNHLEAWDLSPLVQLTQWPSQCTLRLRLHILTWSHTHPPLLLRLLSRNLCKTYG